MSRETQKKSAYGKQWEKIWRDDPLDVRLRKEIFNLKIRLDALDKQIREVAQARDRVRKTLKMREEELENVLGNEG